MNRSSPSKDAGRGYPLAALFVLVAACGILSALARPVVAALQDQVGVGELVATCLLGMLAAGTLGALIGLHHYRRWSGLGWGALTGMLIGLLAGPLALVPPPGFPPLLLASLAGAAVLLIIGTLLRMTTEPN